jgi:hypothetical protein
MAVSWWPAAAIPLRDFGLFQFLIASPKNPTLNRLPYRTYGPWHPDLVGRRCFTCLPRGRAMDCGAFETVRRPRSGRVPTAFCWKHPCFAG